jgi:hypothetical protein
MSVGYTVWQALPAERENPLPRRVGWLTASAMAATSAWMPAFQRSWFALRVVIMLLPRELSVSCLDGIFRQHI